MQALEVTRGGGGEAHSKQRKAARSKQILKEHAMLRGEGRSRAARAERCTQTRDQLVFAF